MGKQEHPLYRNRVAAGSKEILKLAGWLVELHAGRASPPVGHVAPANDIAILVVLGEPPPVTCTVHHRVAVLALDGEKPTGAHQQMIDFASAIAVTPHQGPLVTQGPAQAGRDEQFALYPGREDAFLIGGQHHRAGRRRGRPPLAPYGKDASQPCSHVALCPGPIPLLNCAAHTLVMLRERVLDPQPLTLRIRRTALPRLAEHGTGII